MLRTDACDANPITVTSNDVITAGACTGEYIINREFTATDDCGNVTTNTQVITVEDTTGPILSGVPSDETVECDAVPAAAVVTATDACDTNPIVVTSNDVITAGACTGEYIINREFTATDDCGNVTTNTQVITVEDTTGPVLSGVPSDETVECDAVPAAAVVTATDACDTNPIVVTSNDVITAGACTGEYIINREFTATDDCGNVTTNTQVITVEDTTGPILSGVPSDETVECDAVPAVAVVTATDACDTNPIVVTSNDVITAGACTGEYIINREFTATDDCGNVTTNTQVITEYSSLHSHNHLSL